jgi:hypothetical protein
MNELTLAEGLAFRQSLSTRSKLRLKLQISAGALLAIGLYVAAHYSVLLVAKRAMQA